MLRTNIFGTSLHKKYDVNFCSNVLFHSAYQNLGKYESIDTMHDEGT